MGEVLRTFSREARFVGATLMVALALLAISLTVPANAQATHPVDKNLFSLQSGKCVEVYGYGLHNGAWVVQWACHPGKNQRWIPIHRGNGWYAFMNTHSGKCLEIYGYSTVPGAKAVQWDCHYGANQLWAWSGERLINLHSRMCLDNGSAWQNGARLQQAYCSSNSAQKFRLMDYAY